MNKRKLFFIILIFLVLVLAIFVFGYIYWLKNMKTEPKVPTLIPLTKPTTWTGSGGENILKKP
jgi:predicted ABC-type exoprotein transport system permease subunit